MRTATTRAVAVATACLLGAALTACGADTPEGAPSTSSSTTAESSPGESTGGGPSSRESSASEDTAGAVITIEDFAYSDPGPVAPGAEVTVENDDDTAHTVTADDSGGFDVTIAPGESATFTAPDDAGDYPFSCSFHANMHGTLVVE